MTSVSGIGEPAVRAVRAGEWRLVRDVYLSMLQDSPEAFGETLAEAQARSAAEWSTFVDRCAEGAAISAFVAEDHTGVCGFVRGDTSDPRTPPGTALVSLLWVAPRRRGAGLGRRLMEAVTQWAERRNALRITLGVAESNLGVQKLYEHLGYSDTGIRVPLPSNPALQVVVMMKPLGAQ